MQSIPLHVVIIEGQPGEPEASPTTQDLLFKRVMTSGDTDLSSALKAALGVDLTSYQIVGPGPWVSWSTKASQLKGQQLTLQKCPNPYRKTEQTLYGCNSCQMSNPKGYVNKSKIDPSGSGETKCLPSRPNSNEVSNLEETALKRPDTLSSTFNISIDTQSFGVEEVAMIDVLKLPVYQSYSPDSSDTNNMASTNTTPFPMTPDTDDSLDGHRASYPNVSLTITSVEDELTIDEDTGVKIPLGFQTKNSPNAVEGFPQSEIVLSQDSPKLKSNGQNSQHIQETNGFSKENNAPDGNVQENGFLSHPTRDPKTVSGTLNNLNSSSQTKLKELPFSGVEDNYKCSVSDEGEQQELSEHNSENVKFVVDISSIKPCGPEDTMEVEVDSAVSSCSAFVASPGVVTEVSKSTNATTSLSVTDDEHKDQSPFGGLSPSDYVPFHMLPGNPWSITAEQADGSSRSLLSEEDNMDSLCDNSLADDSDCNSSALAQHISDWNFRRQFVVASNGNALFQGPIMAHPSTQPIVWPSGDAPNDLSQIEAIAAAPGVNQEEQESQNKRAPLGSCNPVSKTDASFLVHTPFSSEENLNNSVPPTYGEVLEYKTDTGIRATPGSNMNNEKFVLVPVSMGNFYPQNGNQENYAVLWHSQSGTNHPTPNPMMSPKSLAEWRVRQPLKPSTSPGTPHRPLPPVNHTPARSVPVSLMRQGQTERAPGGGGEMDNRFTPGDHQPGDGCLTRVTSTSLPPPPPPRQQQQPRLQRPVQRSGDGSEVSDDGASYNYIDSRKVTSVSLPGTTRNRAVPMPPPRRLSQSFTMSLAEQLARVPGWCPDETDRTIEKTMKDFKDVDGYFMVWKSREKNRFVITVSHGRKFNHFLVEEEREDNSRRTTYFIYKHGGYRSKSFLDLVNHYIQSGIKQPLVHERQGLKAYECIHIPLLCPLKVRVVRNRKTQAK